MARKGENKANAVNHTFLPGISDLPFHQVGRGGRTRDVPKAATAAISAIFDIEACYSITHIGLYPASLPTHHIPAAPSYLIGFAHMAKPSL
jgi:hypothetical protein